MEKWHDFLGLEGNSKGKSNISYTFWRLLSPFGISRLDGSYVAK